MHKYNQSPRDRIQDSIPPLTLPPISKGGHGLPWPQEAPPLVTQAAILHVSELSVYRLVFLDSAHVFHQALYQGGGATLESRVRPALRNLAFLASVLTDRAQPPPAREVVKAAIEAFLTVVLAAAGGREFGRADYGTVAEDFASLKRLFSSFVVPDEVVEREATQAEGVVALMAMSTEKLIDEFLGRCAPAPSTAHDEVAQLPRTVPPTTRRWSRSDANTLLHVLCHRDDETVLEESL
ncbi:hypothetical protein EJB05_41541, partial [Eragrostis curvula]